MRLLRDVTGLPYAEAGLVQVSRRPRPLPASCPHPAHVLTALGSVAQLPHPESHRGPHSTNLDIIL
jgi:hypothetical protein